MFLPVRRGATGGAGPRVNPVVRGVRIRRMDSHLPLLVTGATGYVGGRLVPVLLEGGHDVACLVRDPGRAELPDGARACPGDAVSGEGLAEALSGIHTAYYLIHSMGRGNGGEDFAARDRRAARNFGRAAREAGVERVVYLGGLPTADGIGSQHLESRHEVAEILRDLVPHLTYVRAAMVIGGRSASFEVLRALVEHLPAMICPRWVETRSQPVAIDDVIDALARLADRPDVEGEIQLGGAEVLTYLEMMRRFARLEGRRQPLIVKVPVLTPRLSSYWVDLVTPVDGELIRPLIEGLSSEMVVREPPPAGFNDAPRGFDDAVRAALAET